MASYQFNNIIEVLYSVGDVERVLNFYVNYGGWKVVGVYECHQTTLGFWNLPANTSAKEILLQFEDHPTGLMRVIKYEGVKQQHIRSSQQPWDTGGIMDINLRVHEVAGSFDALRDLGWHGLSDPLLQVMGPFKLYDILMKGYDDTIVAFTHRLVPPLELPSPNNLPTHIYNSSLVVKNLKESRRFYEEMLGCKVLNEYEVKKDSPQENMFGLPHNLADKVTCKANILSFDGERDVVFQIIEFDGVTGKDFSDRALPPNRGFLLYRVEVKNIQNYYDILVKKYVPIHQPLSLLSIEPYGRVQCFAVVSPNGVLWEFMEKVG